MRGVSMHSEVRTDAIDMVEKVEAELDDLIIRG